MTLYKGFTELNTDELFAKDSNVKDTRSHTLKLEKPGCIRDSRKYSHTHKVVATGAVWIKKRWMHFMGVNWYKTRTKSLCCMLTFSSHC